MPDGKLPLYEIAIDDTSMDGVSGISLVDEPAIMVNWVALRKAAVTLGQAMGVKRKTPHLLQDAKRKMLYGPVLIPDQQIYRREELEDGSLHEYNIVYRKDTIEQAAHKFMLAMAQRKITHQHQTMQEGVCVVESWITAGADDKAKQLGFDLPEGTWMVGVKVLDDKYWNEEIMSGKVKGFSLEGFFGHVPVTQHKRPTAAAKQAKIMGFYDTVKQRLLGKQAQKQTTAKAKPVKQAAAGFPAKGPDGSDVILIYGGDDTVMIMPMDGGDIVPAPDGAYETKAGPINVMGGKVQEMGEEQPVEQTVNLNAEDFLQVLSAEGYTVALPEGFSQTELRDNAGNVLGVLKFEAAAPAAPVGDNPNLVQTNPAESNKPVADPANVTIQALVKRIQQLESQVAAKPNPNASGLRTQNMGNAQPSLDRTNNNNVRDLYSNPNKAAILQARQQKKGGAK